MANRLLQRMCQLPAQFMQSTSNQSEQDGSSDPKNFFTGLVRRGFSDFFKFGRAPSLGSEKALFASAWCAIPRKRARVRSMRSSLEVNEYRLFFRATAVLLFDKAIGNPYWKLLAWTVSRITGSNG